MESTYNDYRIEEKIANIKQTLEKLGSSIIPDEPTNYSHFFDKPINHASKTIDYDYMFTENSPYHEERPLQYSPEPQQGYRYQPETHDQYLKASYSVGDLKEDDRQSDQSAPSPQFASRIEDSFSRKSLVSDYVAFGDTKTNWLNEAQSNYSSNGFLQGEFNKQSLDLDKERLRPQPKSQEEMEMSILLEYEREKISQLERRIQQKDKVIEEMTKMQQDLMSEIRNQQDKIGGLERNLEEVQDREYQIQYESTSKRQTEIPYEFEEILNEKRQLQNENLQLKHEIERHIIYIGQLESQLQTTQDETAKIYDSETQANSQILKLKKEKVKLLRDIERQKNQINELQSQLSNFVRQDKNDANDTNKAIIKRKDMEIQRLVTINDKLVQDSQIYKKKSINNLQKKINDLEQTIKELKRSRAKSPNRVQQRNKGSSKPNSKIETLKQGPNQNQRIISQLQAELNLKSPYGILPTIKSYIKQLKQLNQHDKLISKMTQLITDCSPPNTLDSSPSLNQIWRWMKRLIEEYLYLKKNIDSKQSNQKILSRLLSILQAEEISEIPKTINKIVAERDHSMLILEKVKTLLDIEPNTTLPELEVEIDNKI